FTKVPGPGERGGARWKGRAGGSVTLSFEFEVVEPVPSLMFLVRLSIAANGELLTMIREVVCADPLPVGRIGTIDLTLPDIPLRPSEIALYASLGRVDNQVFYDVMDENVDLPFLRVFSDSDDRFVREGMVSLPYSLTLRNGDVA